MIETMIWIGIAVVTALLLWLAAPYHRRLIEAAHAKADRS